MNGLFAKSVALVAAAVLLIQPFICPCEFRASASHPASRQASEKSCCSPKAHSRTAQQDGKNATPVDTSSKTPIRPCQCGHTHGSVAVQSSKVLAEPSPSLTVDAVISAPSTPIAPNTSASLSPDDRERAGVYRPLCALLCRWQI